MGHYSLKEQLNRYSRLTLPGQKSNIHVVRWSPDGSYLATGGKDKIVNLYRATEADMVPDVRYTSHGHSNVIDMISWNPASIYQFATASLDKTAKIWDIRGFDPVASIRLKDENNTVSWAGDGHTIAVADRSDWISFLDMRMDNKVTRDIKCPFEVNDLAWYNDLLFVTSGEGNVHVYSYPDLQTLMVIDAFASPCICIRFDPTGKYFAVGSSDAISSVWCSQNLACISAIDRLEWPVKAISFSHDGKYLASGSEDNFIDISQTRTGDQVMVIDLPTNAPTLTLDFHPKHYILAYALDEHDYRDMGTVKVVGFPEKERRNDIRHQNSRMQ